MRAGQFVQQGSARHVYQQPIDEYCAGLLGSYNLADVNADPAFAGWPVNLNSQKKLLIRPEHISISNQNKDGIRGTIQTILFWGSYYTIDVQVGKQLIRVQTRGNDFKVGAEVTLTLSANNSCWL